MPERARIKTAVLEAVKEITIRRRPRAWPETTRGSAEPLPQNVARSRHAR
jgi:hypothetical protein